MLSDDLRKRLAAMRRGSASDSGPTDPSPLRTRLAQAAQALEQRRGSLLPQMSIEEAIPGQDVQTASGRFYLVEPDPRTLHVNIESIAREHDQLRQSTQPASAPFTTLGTDPSRWLYLDIETTGLSGVPLFLIGLMHLDGDRIRVVQLLARDYSEESPLLAHLAEVFPRFDCLVTFNGQTFDLPYIRDRFFANALRCRFPGRHLDLLPFARRRWRAKLPDCKLQTLERWVCGRRRDGDIPSSDIPETYHLFVRTGNAALIRPILDHNALDLVTMGELLLRLVEPQ
ncbi:MAG: ribonuclease H-like domain-containing protein [Candidatus Latescibacteria bacterium]|nr:ribonuclease H-like domain-containing protein [Candidatus Latescibacterota bacterium]